MKRFLALVALVLGLASCQTEPEGLNVNVGGEVDTTITVTIPETETRYGNEPNSALGVFDNGILDNENTTMRYILEIYYGDIMAERQVQFSDEQKTIAFPVRLVPNRHYNFVVWADVVTKNDDEAQFSDKDYHYNTKSKTNADGVAYGLDNVSLNNNTWVAMDESRDAFTGYHNTEEKGTKYTGTLPINITLTRPFAKLRVMTKDMQQLKNLNIRPTTAVVTYKDGIHRESFNALKATYSDRALTKQHTFTISTNDETYANMYGETYTNDAYTLFTDYFFAPKDDADVVNFTLDVYDQYGTDDVNLIKSNPFNTAIPAQRNYLTTISGNILTDGNNIEVTVNDAFADADGNEQHIYIYEYNGYIYEPLVLSTGAYIFRDLTMNLSSDNAVIIEENADVTIDVVGKVNLKAVKEAIKVSAGATLTINGMQPTRSNVQTGEVVADGGIGGNEEGVTININDIAELTAMGHGDHAFGIGGSNADVNIDNTTIDYVSGGHVQALFIKDEKYGKSEPEGGAAIGGKKVVISNSTIRKAEGGSKAAAIGNNYWQSTEVVITDSELHDIWGGNASAAIGGSRYSENISADAKQVTKVKIEKSTIANAVGGQAGAGIGSGYDTHCAANETNSVNEIVIVNSTITAQGGKYAAGIGTGFHAASLTGSIDAESTINATSGEPFYKGTYTFAQHIGYGVIDPAREGENLNVTFEVNGSAIAKPSVYTTYNEVNTKEQLQAALNAAIEGTNTIVLGADIEGDVTVVQKPGVKIAIDGNGKKYNGSIKVHSNSEHYATAALTIKNVNFETSSTYKDKNGATCFNFVEALENGSERYSTNITVEDCTFTATDAAVNIAVGLQIKSSKWAKVLKCTATDMHSLIQAQSCDETVVVNGCTINGKNGVAFKQVKAATVEGTTIVAAEYGIRFDGNTDNYGIVVKDNNVTANQPFIVRKMTGKNNTITLEGENTLTTDAEYQIVITNGSDDEAYVAPTGTYTLTGADEYTLFPVSPVAKVGNTEYTTIDEAIANWTKGSTLTLLKNVTLTDVITLKSTEHHILDLGTYTMTAASGKHAIEITCNGLSNATYALTINADTTNPGGITATGKSCIYYKKSDNTKDRPIILINNGVFTGSYSINSTSNGNTNCPQVWINGGVFNSYMSLTKNMLKVSGGTFHGAINCTGDSSAYRQISGGRFKSWQFMTADADNKFWVGTAKATYDVGVYVDKEGYLVVGGPVITEFGDKFAAKATNPTKWSSYLKYSSAAANGLYYEDADMAIKKHGEDNVVLK